MKLLRRGRILEIPLYFTLRLSDLAREGIDHSGSWAFADHIYRGEPSGRGPLGRWLDARLLSMPSARSFRNRYLAASERLADFLAAHPDRPLHVLSAPCGLPRELARGARLARERALHRHQADDLANVTFHGLDLDADVLNCARVFARDNGLTFVSHHGDVFARSAYPHTADFVTCTGLGEFLDDAQLERLYALFYDVLQPGGWLVTSGMKRYWASAYLLQLAELETHYRASRDLERIVRRAGFQNLRVHADDVGLQTIVTAEK